NILGGQAAGFSVLTGKHSAVQVMGAMKRAAGKLGASQVVGKGIMETLRETKNLVSAYGGKRTFSFYEDFIKSKFTAGSLELRFADQLEAHGLGVGSGLETSELSELNRGVGNKVMNRTMRVARAMPEAAET